MIAWDDGPDEVRKMNTTPASTLADCEQRVADLQRQLAESKAEKYSRGQLVDVYYNPKKPSDASLSIEDPTHGFLPWVMIIVGIIILGTGGVWMLRVAAHMQ